jgi:hypothetical protein
MTERVMSRIPGSSAALNPGMTEWRSQKLAMTAGRPHIGGARRNNLYG